MFPIGLSGLDCCTGLNLCFAYLLIYLEGFVFWWGRLKMTSFPTLVKRTPFGLAMTRLPDHTLQPLLALDILPTQSGGELFLQMSLERTPDDDPNGMNGSRWTDGVIRSDRLDPTNPAHLRSTLVRTTAWFDTFIMDCLSRLPDPDAPGEKDSIID